MGVQVDYTFENVFIPKEQRSSLLRYCKDTYGNRTFCGASMNHTKVVDLLEDWSIEWEENPVNGDIQLRYFEAEKVGEEWEILFPALKGFVRSGGVIIGKDDHTLMPYRITYKDNLMVEEEASFPSDTIQAAQSEWIRSSSVQPVSPRIAKTPVVYVAGKYRGETRWEVEQNIREAEKYGFELAEKYGVIPLIPHTMYRHFDGELTDAFWLDSTLELMKRCDGIVLIHNWMGSTGARTEFAVAKKLNLPVFGRAEPKFEELFSRWVQATQDGAGQFVPQDVSLPARGHA